MATTNLGRVQGAGFFYTTESSATTVALSTITPTGIKPLVGDCILFSNGDVREVTAVSASAATCGAVLTSLKGLKGDKGDTPSTTEILKAIYPVGSVYINRTNGNNPGTLLGFGTWTRISQKFLYGQYSGDSSGTSLGSTGGETTHKLTINEMPAHSHSFDGWGSVVGNNGYISGAASKNISSSQSFNMNDTGGDQAHNNMPPYVVVAIWYRYS